VIEDFLVAALSLVEGCTEHGKSAKNCHEKAGAASILEIDKLETGIEPPLSKLFDLEQRDYQGPVLLFDIRNGPAMLYYAMRHLMPHTSGCGLMVIIF